MSEDDDSPKKPAAATVVKKEEAAAAQATAAQASAQAHARAEAQPVGKTLTGLQVCCQWHQCSAEVDHNFAVELCSVHGPT